jgi:hypothetical protein
METVRLGIAGVFGAFLFAGRLACAAHPAAPANAPAATTRAAARNAAVADGAKAPTPEVPALCVRAPALCSAEYQASGQADASPVIGEVSTLELPDGTVVADPDDASGQSQAQSGSGPQSNQPSLEGLGFPKSEIQGSAKEQALLNKRSHMLQIHQKLGLITAVPMAVALFTGPGAKGHHGLPGSPGGRNLHATLGGITTGLYIATAYYAIRAPKVQGTEPRGLIRLHRALAWVHGSGMVITPILGAIAYSQLSNGERIHGVARYHSVAAGTTFAAYMAALLSVSLK